MDLTRNEALLAGVGGIAAIAGSAYQFVKTERFRKTATRTQGRVTELVYSPGSGDMTGTYAPRFEYKTPDGETWTILSGTGSSPSAFHVGEDITVLYEPDHPTGAEIDSVTQLWTSPAILGIFGIVALGVWLKWILEV